ncbi:MAG: hypothetical protein Q7I99_08110 [Acholeplasmataceae bacterium]|nr:hypothetical protein [Acholeplasmataceae bacterium]
MATVAFGNFYYFLYIALGVLITLLMVRFLRNKTTKFRYWFIFGLIIFNLLIHFLKIFIYPYNTVPYVLTKVSFENVCAVSALLYPFLFFAKNKTLKDYMVLVGMASGIITFIYPVDVMSLFFNGQEGFFSSARPAFMFENIRFYLSHLIIFLVPFLMMHYGFHTLSIKRAYRAPFMLVIILVIIFINELILTMIGWIPKSQFFDPRFRNPSFIFGVRGDLGGLGMILGVFVPMAFRSNPWFIGEAYLPVIWLVLPAMIYGGLIALAFMFIYDTKETLYFFKLKMRIKPFEEPYDLKE